MQRPLLTHPSAPRFSFFSEGMKSETVPNKGNAGHGWASSARGRNMALWGGEPAR